MRHKGTLTLVFGLMAVTILMGTTAWADAIAITNSSFENPIKADNGYTSNVISGWTVTGNAAGVYNTIASAYPGGAPDGQQVLWVHGSTTVSQVLGAVLEANEQYELSASVGRRADSGSYPAAQPVNYSIQLWAGSTLLTSIDGTSPAAGTFVPVSTLFTSDASWAAAFGQNLIIKFVNNNANASWPYQVNFDAVDLTVSTPEPGTLALMGTGLASLAGMLRRRFVKR